MSKHGVNLWLLSILNGWRGYDKSMATVIPQTHLMKFLCPQLLFFFPPVTKTIVNLKCSGLSQESHDEESLELSYLTSDTCPLMCDNSFQTSLSPGPAPKHPPSPTILSFFYTKIHESLATGVTKGWIKVLLLPLHRLKSPQFSWISLNERIIHARSYTTKPRKVKLMAEIFNFVLEKCSLQSVRMYFIFLRCLPATYVSQRGRGKWRNIFFVYSPFYVQLWDLLTQFNYGTFPKRH